MKDKVKARANNKTPTKKNKSKPKYETKPNLDLIHVWNEQPNLRSHKNNQSKVYGDALKKLEHLRRGILHKIISQDEIANGTFANGLPTDWPKVEWKKKDIARAIKNLNEWCKEGNYPENKDWIKKLSLSDAIYNSRTGTSALMSAYKNGVQPLFNPNRYLETEQEKKIYDKFEQYFEATKSSTKKKIIELVKNLSGQREQYHNAWKQAWPEDVGLGDHVDPANSFYMINQYLSYLRGEKLQVNDFKPRANISPLSLKTDGFPWKKFVEAFQLVYTAHPISGPV